MESLRRLAQAIYEDVGVHAALGLLVLFWCAARCVYNLYLHPLSGLPGPRLWAASRLPFIYHLLRGTLVKRERKLHEKYGGAIRVAPDEISFATVEAWNDIYARRAGHKRPPRDSTLFFAPGEGAENLLTTTNVRIHSRQRGLLGNAFTESSLKASHPLIQGYCDLLIQKFEEMVLQDRERRALVDMTDWMMFFTMDVVGDLSLGESFGCLEKGQYHDWIRKLFQYVKAITVVAAPRYYSVRVTDFVLRNLLPRSVTEGQKAHKRYADDRINRRLDKLDAKTECSRPDFMTPFMANNANYEIMSRDEITSTFNFIILGGSDTCATPLTGLFNHLSRQPAILARVTKEIRDHFQSEKDIVLDALPGGDVLPYLEAVINEALRMCNPIPAGLPRRVPEGGDTYSGVFLPGGTRMRVQTYSISRSATYFHRPDSFCPERWLPKGSGSDSPRGVFDGDNLAASKPFGTGFSACLGWRVALGQMLLVVSRVLWRFDITEDAAEPVDFDDWALPSFVEKGPMRIWLRLRDGF